MTGDVAFLDWSGVNIVWMENIECVFRVKPLFSNAFGIMWTGARETCVLKVSFFFGTMFFLSIGIGFASIAVSFLVSVYYNVIMAWSLFYFYQAFKKDIPWVGCHHPWNTLDCYIFNASNPNASGASPSREFLV